MPCYLFGSLVQGLVWLVAAGIHKVWFGLRNTHGLQMRFHRKEFFAKDESVHMYRKGLIKVARSAGFSRIKKIPLGGCIDYQNQVFVLF